MGMRSGLFVPMIVGDRAIGVIAAHNKRGPDPRFTDEDLRVAETFAAARRRRRRPRRPGRARRAAPRRRGPGARAAAARPRAARRDRPGADVDPARTEAGRGGQDEGRRAEQAAAELRGEIVKTLQAVRRLAVELRPKALDDFGLVPALERLAEAFGGESGIAVDVEANLGETRLPAEVETALYRIAQEASDERRQARRGRARERRRHPARRDR